LDTRRLLVYPCDIDISREHAGNHHDCANKKTCDPRCCTCVAAHQRYLKDFDALEDEIDAEQIGDDVEHSRHDVDLS
jgi:hypothetical protein